MFRIGGGNCGGDPNVLQGSYEQSVVKYDTGSMYIGRGSNITRGKRKGVKFIIKVL